MGWQGIRVVSYNILVDQFCNTEWPRQNLYWYTDPRHLSINYRIPLIAREIEGYNASVVCLQEVEGKVFAEELMPLLNRMGLDAR